MSRSVEFLHTTLPTKHPSEYILRPDHPGFVSIWAGHDPFYKDNMVYIGFGSNAGELFSRADTLRIAKALTEAAEFQKDRRVNTVDRRKG